MAGSTHPADRMEVCFAGRSKRREILQLINALTGMTALGTRPSNTPGRTQEINFFTAAEEQLPRRRYLVMAYAKCALPLLRNGRDC